MRTLPFIQSLQLRCINIPFKLSFKHASATRTQTAALWVEATSITGLTGVGEGCPRPYVTGESLESATLFFQQYQAELIIQVQDLASLRDWIQTHTSEIDRNPAAWCALELALLDVFAQQQGCSMETLLGTPEIIGPFRYSAVLGDASPEQFDRQCEQYIQRGFCDFKVKLSGDIQRDRKKLALLTHPCQGASLRIRLDANNLWPEAISALAFFEALPASYFAIEEPLHVGHYAELLQLAQTLGVRIVLDESFLREDQFDCLSTSPQTWIINLRVSKMGGLIRSLAIVEQAKKRGIALIIGAQVGETSLLTRAAWTVAQAASDALLAQEGAFGTHLLSVDVHSPALMFGAGGSLNPGDFLKSERIGWGLRFHLAPDLSSAPA